MSGETVVRPEARATGPLGWDSNRNAMKIACSSASFAREIAAGTMTQLEWLDVCANELEVDGVIFDAGQFPRADADYLAQLKKSAADLGLTVAGVAASDLFTASGAAHIERATALGAPLAIGPAPNANDDADAWGAFTTLATVRAREAKRANVTLAVRNAAGTVCTTSADLKRLAKDVDSSWLRFAGDDARLSNDDEVRALRPKTVIAWHAITNFETFALAADPEAKRLVDRLARFRGFVVLGGQATPANRGAYHAAIERFATFRARSLDPTVYQNL